LIDHGADIEAKDDMGETPLHIAVKSKSPTIAVEILLRHGADPNALDEKGLSCLNKAKGNAAVVHQLIKSGTDAFSGNNPFILDAIESMDLMTVKLLASLGADFNRKPPAEEEEEKLENEDDSNDAKAMG
jgi:ankyrin repeat protein